MDESREFYVELGRRMAALRAAQGAGQAIFGANGFMLPALLATSGILIFAGRKEVQA